MSVSLGLRAKTRGIRERAAEGNSRSHRAIHVYLYEKPLTRTCLPVVGSPIAILQMCLGDNFLEDS